MTNWISKFSLILLASAALVFTSCSDDDTPDPIFNPTLSLVAGEDNIGATFLPGEEFTFTITGQEGSEKLNAISFREGEDLMDLSRIKINGDALNANPTLLFADNKTQFTFEISLTANNESGEYSGSIVLSDEANRSATIDFNYIIDRPSDLDSLMGVLLNSDGPIGTGGINLETGEGTGSADQSAHIRDLGINTDLIPAENWIQKIAPITANGVTLKMINDAPSFEEVIYSEQLEALYEEGTEVTSEGTAEKVQVGDTFVAKQGEQYFFFVIKEVNVTTDDNMDNYVIDIKK
ncbi:MAG: hypothetical protein EA362_11880 [Saprospirales bacterium]|nr:MAG: hypothetical protein EA362_11880 [Saprospirales bacterium]